MRSLIQNLVDFIKSTKGALDDKIIGLIVAGLILFSLFGTMYTQYVAGNTSMTDTCGEYGNYTCPTTHIALFPLIMTFLLIGFVLMVWRSAKRGR